MSYGELFGVIAAFVGVISVIITIFLNILSRDRELRKTIESGDRYVLNQAAKNTNTMFNEINHIKQTYARRDDIAQQFDRLDRNLHHVYTQQIETNKRLDALLNTIASKKLDAVR